MQDNFMINHMLSNPNPLAIKFLFILFNYQFLSQLIKKKRLSTILIYIHIKFKSDRSSNYMSLIQSSSKAIEDYKNYKVAHLLKHYS